MNLLPGSQQIHTVFCIDEDYAPHLSALLLSIQANNNCFVHCHVIYQTLSSKSKERLISPLNEFMKVHFHKFNSSLNRCTLSERYTNRVTLTTYYRLYLTEILPKKLDRVIYLDADLICMGSLLELWNIPLNGNMLGVVEDSALSAEKRWNTLGLIEERYFNAGVLIIDLEAWRKKGIVAKLLQLADAQKDFEYNDQDVLNVEFNRNSIYLPKIWNAQSYDFKNNQIENTPQIIHFTGAEKPWHEYSVHPFKKEYLKYRRKTEWRQNIFELNLSEMEEERLRCLVYTLMSNNKKEIYIYGAGQLGRKYKAAIERYYPWIKIKSYIDKDKSLNLNESKILNNLNQLDEDCMIFISSKAFRDEIIKDIVSNGISESEII